MAGCASGTGERGLTGLPSPLAAGALISVVLAHVSLTSRPSTFAYGGVAILTVLVGLLMVSNVRYRTFKDASLRSREGLVILALLAASITAGAVFKPSLAVVILMALYVIMGLIGALIHLSRSILSSDSEEEADFSQELAIESDEKLG